MGAAKCAEMREQAGRERAGETYVFPNPVPSHHRRRARMPRAQMLYASDGWELHEKPWSRTVLPH